MVLKLVNRPILYDMIGGANLDKTIHLNLIIIIEKFIFRRD